MARGEMVRFMAGIHAEEPEQIKAFDWSGYLLDEGTITAADLNGFSDDLRDSLLTYIELRKNRVDQ
jgi:hypothetical protein